MRREILELTTWNGITLATHKHDVPVVGGSSAGTHTSKKGK